MLKSRLQAEPCQRRSKLGSSRLASAASRTVYNDGAYGPFGEPYARSGTSDRNFTGMNQGTAANVYDFSAREYGIQERWPSPDPTGCPFDVETGCLPGAAAGAVTGTIGGLLWGAGDIAYYWFGGIYTTEKQLNQDPAACEQPGGGSCKALQCASRL